MRISFGCINAEFGTVIFIFINLHINIKDVILQEELSSYKSC